MAIDSMEGDEILTREVYLDNSATTIVYPQVADAMVECLTKAYGNPSSLHKMGLEAEKKVALARKQTAKVLGCKPKELIFTSGGSESNNLAIKGIAYFYQNRGNHIIVSKTEHPSVIAACESLENEGFEITYLDVNKYGEISLDQLADKININTILVSVMMVNNELGTIQPIEEAVSVINQKSNKNKIFIHVDGVQAIGVVPINLTKLGADLFSISGHKFHGPKGIGALFVKEGTQLKAIIDGGGQESNLRAGTENVPGIAGMTKALAIASSNIEEKVSKLKFLQKLLWKGIKEKVSNCKLNSDLEKGAPHIVSISFPGIKGEVMLHYLESEGVYVSTGSACSSRTRNMSHVLTSIGLNESEADGTIRFSFSNDTSEEDINYAVKKTVDGVRELKEVMGR